MSLLASGGERVSPIRALMQGRRRLPATSVSQRKTVEWVCGSAKPTESPSASTYSPNRITFLFIAARLPLFSLDPSRVCRAGLPSQVFILPLL